MRACVFTVAGTRFALPVAQVRELCPADEDLTPVPGAPPRVLGVLGRHGRIVPVVQLGDGPRTGSGAGLLVLECSRGPVATPVESVDGIAVLTSDDEIVQLDLEHLFSEWSEEVARAFDAGRSIAGIGEASGA